MPVQLVPTIKKEGHLGEYNPALEIIGVLLGQAEILTISAPAVAFFKLQLGHGSTRIRMITIQVEDIAQLHHGAIYIAFRDKRNGILEMLLGPFLGRLAGGQEQGADHQKYNGGKLTQNTHR